MDNDNIIDKLEAKFDELFSDDDSELDFSGDEISNIIEIYDEEGNEISCEFLDLIEYDGQQYVVLLPTEDEAQEVIILMLDGEDEETESYASVQDEEVLAAVFGIFKEKFKDYFNFVD